MATRTSGSYSRPAARLPLPSLRCLAFATSRTSSDVICALSAEDSCAASDPQIWVEGLALHRRKRIENRLADVVAGGASTELLTHRLQRLEQGPRNYLQVSAAVRVMRMMTTWQQL